ncbi:sulfotransferase 1C2-like [Asterias rubens]|uniref:sulfotransferase 1C2-like n=1 Tax=Asterias rubens TaxID=7604 RepID=UPI00145535F1|nr:sulfotransferase 1C2-like [Asterias rubens]
MANTKDDVDVNNNIDLQEALGCKRIGGILYAEFVTERSLNAVKNYDVRHDDVWICAYPKAGNNWLCEIVKLIHADGYKDKIDRSRLTTPITYDRYLDREPQYEEAVRWESPRVFYSHLYEPLLPTQLRQGKGKIIFLIRNPKDSAVSFYHFLKPRKYPNFCSWDEFVKLYGTENMRWGSWFDHTISFVNTMSDYKNLLLLKYEDMKSDTRGAVLKIAGFLNISLSDEALDRIVSNASVATMKTTFFVNGEGTFGEKTTHGKIGIPHIIRKGTVGDWKNMFTTAQSGAFDEMFKQRMTGTHLRLQFE